MRFMTLAEMLDGLRIEARISQNVAHGVTLRDPHIYLINRIQDELFLNFDWPHLKTTARVTLEAGQRYAEYPSGMTMETVEKVYSEHSPDKFEPIDFGIGVTHINAKNPEKEEDRGHPVRRWANYIPPDANTNFNMFEVWPVPDRATTLIVKGLRAPKLLTQDNDKTILDGPSIVLHAAAELLAAQKAEDASLKLNKAQERIRTLKIRARGSDNTPINLAGGGSTYRPRYGLDYVE